MKKTINILLRIAAVFILLYSIAIAYFNIKYPRLDWDWDEKNISDLHFPKPFLWGVASASYQVEGGETKSNWSWWETQKDESGKPRIANGDKSGLATDHWNRYPEDIGLMQNLGVNSYRMSLSWSKICPKKGVYDTSVLNHYSAVIDSLLAKNIIPNITLHHFDEPLWFMQNGGFEKEENISYYTEFVSKVFLNYGNRVHYWTTFNEVEIFATQGYMMGEFPPGKKEAKVAGTVLLNVLKAHVLAYKLIKKLPYGEQSEIGIVKDIFLFEPKNRLNLLDWLTSYFINDSFNDSSLDFFETGEYHFYIPQQANITYTDKDAPNNVDYMGLNYYSHLSTVFNTNDPSKMTSAVAGEEMTDMNYSFYPEGIYLAIQRMARIKKPIIITETGIADADDTKRGKFIKRVLYSVSEAIKDGYDVKGFYYWSLTDNFEWALGYSKRFGLYKVDYKTQKRKLRKGSEEYQKIIKKFK
jgi:beta-glucosidase